MPEYDWALCRQSTKPGYDVPTPQPAVGGLAVIAGIAIGATIAIDLYHAVADRAPVRGISSQAVATAK